LGSTDEELNKLIKRDLNATVKVEYLSFADYTQRYPLLFATGEKIDLIYTSDWAFYDQEAVKGAFTEVTEDILKTYMPQTWAGQDPLSFEQAKIGGKAYFVPISLTPTASGNAILIRGDLREKYGLPEIKTVDDLEAYFTAVAQNEKGIFPYAASKHNNDIKGLLLNVMNELVVLNNGQADYFHTYKGDGKEDVSANDLGWLYESEQYIPFVKKMKEWSDKGFWSKNVVANATQPRDAFEQGTSASLIWNIGTLAVTKQSVEKVHPEWKPEIYDISEGKTLMIGKYTGDGMAVPANAPNPERAFMLLDKLKFDEEYNNLVRLGIKGKHWEPEGEDRWKPGPNQEKYRFGSGGSWGFKGEHERTSINQPPIVKVLADKRAERMGKPVSLGLRIDNKPIANELAAVNSAKTKYLSLLELGLVVMSINGWRISNRRRSKPARRKSVPRLKSKWMFI
jgi:putative aldouronate transport system substrate-binding protein